jgi:hypothetical protein
MTRIAPNTVANDEKWPVSEPEPRRGHLEHAKGAHSVSRLAKTPADQRFDVWLQKQLRVMYEIEASPAEPD